MIVAHWFPYLLSVSIVAGAGSPLTQQQRPAAQISAADADRDLRHQSDEWRSLAPHLPDPLTGTPQSLQVAADVLRARRMPEDALEYYNYALRRGGDEATLENRIGVTELELRRPVEAKAAFQRAVLLRKNDGRNWNNLGSAEFIGGNLRAALIDYERAVKLDKKAAVYRSNLGSAYFELKDYDSARSQFQKAVKLDQNVFHEGGWAGTEAHVLTLTDRGRFCFEMARIAASQKDDVNTLSWLAKAAETGFDVRGEMEGERDFQAYVKDRRVTMILSNAKAMLAKQVAAGGSVTPLPEAAKKP